MCPIQPTLLVSVVNTSPVLKRMHTLTTFCLSDVSGLYPLILKKTDPKNHFQNLKEPWMLVHGVWVDLGPGRRNLFSCFFITLQGEPPLQNQGRRVLKSCRPSLLFLSPRSIKRSQRKREEVEGRSVACGTSPPQLVSAQINNRVVKVSADSAFAVEVLVGALPAPEHHHSQSCPYAHLKGKAWATPEAIHLWDGPSRAAQGLPRGHISWQSSTGSCPPACRSTPSMLLSAHSHCCLEGRSRKSSA